MNFQPPDPEDDPRDDDQRMRDAELEAHRVRFEQRYADFRKWPLAAVTAFHDGGYYNHPDVQDFWQAYQWAIADADRAQRAAHGVQGGSARQFVEWIKAQPEDREPTTLLETLAEFEAAQPPQQSAQPVERKYISPVKTVADLANNLLMMDQTLPIYGAQYIEHSTRGRCAIAVSPTVSRERVADSRWIGQGTELNAAVVWTRAAQPVEVQPLTDAEANSMAAMSAEGGLALACNLLSTVHKATSVGESLAAIVAYRKAERLAAIRETESAHGIKPTSSEGGAA